LYNNVPKSVEKSEKIFKYEDLILEIQSMWNVKARLISVITEATGTFSKSLRKYLSNIRGKHEVKEQHKTATVGTALHTACRMC
jgi:hypothetical protein